MILLLLIAAGAVRAMLSGPPAEVPALAAKMAPDSKPHGATACLTVAKSAKQVERPARFSGFAVHPTAPLLEALRLPPRTVAEIMSLTHPSALASTSAETAGAPMAEQRPAPKPVTKAKRKRTLAARAPQPLPWWQEWSWIRVR
jgi:hypothetical protein